MKDLFAQGGSGSAGIKTNKQAIARACNVKVSEVIYSNDTLTTLDGKKIIYDKPNQHIWGLPSGIPSGATIVSVTGSTLVYVPGNVSIELVPNSNSADALRNELASTNGAELITTASGETVQDYINNNTIAVPTFAAALENTSSAGFIRTLGHTSEGVGSAVYQKDGTTGTPSSGDEVKFFDANGIGWKFTPLSSGFYDSQALGLIPENISEGVNNSKKLQKIMDTFNRVDFTGGDTYFKWWQYQAIGGEPCCVLLDKGAKVFTHGNARIVQQTNDTAIQVTPEHPFMFNSKFINGSVRDIEIKASYHQEGIAGLLVARRVNRIHLHDCTLTGGYFDGGLAEWGSRTTVVLLGCSDYLIDNVEFYSRDVDSDYSALNANYPGFAIRANTSFVPLASQSYFSYSGKVTRCKFHGYIYNATEIAGSGTSFIELSYNDYVDCALTPIDFDKGVFRCSALFNRVIRLQRGPAFAADGGTDWIPMRAQGYVTAEYTLESVGCRFIGNEIIDTGASATIGTDAPNFIFISNAPGTLVSNNRGTNSYFGQAHLISNSANVSISNTQLVCLSAFYNGNTNSPGLIVRGCKFDTYRRAIDVANTGNKFSGMTNFRFVDCDFNYVGGTTFGYDGVYFESTGVVNTGLFHNCRFYAYNRPYVVGSGSGHKIMFKGNIGINCQTDPVVITGSPSVEYSSITGI